MNIGGIAALGVISRTQWLALGEANMDLNSFVVGKEASFYKKKLLLVSVFEVLKDGWILYKNFLI